jgi:hypothetical protein
LWALAIFSGNAAESDMPMRSKNTGQFEIYDINHSRLSLARRWVEWD